MEGRAETEPKHGRNLQSPRLRCLRIFELVFISENGRCFLPFSSFPLPDSSLKIPDSGCQQRRAEGRYPYNQ
jgi:hypothetical protein